MIRTLRCWFLLFILGLLGSSSMAAGIPLTLQLDWTPNTNHTGIYVALEKGWYKNAGLDVHILPPGSASVEALVGAGKADFGISFQEWVTSARIGGVPVVSIAAVLQHNTSGFASINRGIKRPSDMEGKRYGGWSLPVEKAILKGLMQADKANVDTVKFVDLNADIDLVTLLQRDIDFTWIYYGWQGIEAEQRGIKLDMVKMSDYFKAVPDYYTPVIITAENLIRTNPAAIKAFMKATSMGYQFAAANPAQAAEILIKHVPELDPDLVRRSQAWLSPRYIADAPRFGYQKTSVWQDFADWMYENKLVRKQLDVSKAFTNQFLP